MGIFSPIIIDVSPSSFVFSSPKTTLQLDTYLWVDTTHESVSVVAIGEDVDEVLNIKRVDLFKGSDYPSISGGKTMYLEAFLRYGIYKIRSSFVVSLFKRSTVVFRGAETLESILGGYQEGILDHIARMAGAAKVLFE